MFLKQKQSVSHIGTSEKQYLNNRKVCLLIIANSKIYE